MSRRHVLVSGLQALGISLPDASVDQLLNYVELLEKWNQTYNLTAIRHGDDMVTQHLLDSLALVPYLNGVHSLADIGSGAGLPGIPLAIACPALAVTLIESVQKKSAFQQQAKIALGLKNVSIYSGRVEDLKQFGAFDATTARAFSSLSALVVASQALLKPDGHIYAMKGVLPEDEIAALPAGWKVSRAQSIIVPGLDVERHLLILERN